MIKLIGKTISTEMLDKHHRICDLINLEIPVLSLYSDGRKNWIYLWCDTDNSDNRHRWLIFPVSRDLLVKYLGKKSSMLELTMQAASHLVLDITEKYGFTSHGDPERLSLSRNLRLVSIDQFQEYLPTLDSFFDPSLTNDLDLAEQLVPAIYELPIQGSWFSQDFENLFRQYERIYAFFYATRPRLIKTIGDRLEGVLRAPWMGGFSRVNMFNKLAQAVPALHALKIDKIKYASPGEVQFEAIESIGISIHNAVISLIKNDDAILSLKKEIREFLSEARLNKIDLSKKVDIEIDMRLDHLNSLNQKCKEIGVLLGIGSEFKTLLDRSPNTVVFSKAVVSFVKQLDRLASFQRDDMLDLHRSKTPGSINQVLP